MTEDSKISAECAPNLFYKCRESSTNRPYFMQNKANFEKAQMNASSTMIKGYENGCLHRRKKNKPKQSQSAIGGQVSEDRRQKFTRRRRDIRQQAEYKPRSSVTRPQSSVHVPSGTASTQHQAVESFPIQHLLAAPASLCQIILIL